MKVKITEKPHGKHENPPLIAGHVYQELDSKGYYLAGRLSLDDGLYIVLINLSEGVAWASDGGYGISGARFIDVTEDSTFIVEI